MPQCVYEVSQGIFVQDSSIELLNQESYVNAYPSFFSSQKEEKPQLA